MGLVHAYLLSEPRNIVRYLNLVSVCLDVASVTPVLLHLHRHLIELTVFDDESRRGLQSCFARLLVLPRVAHLGLKLQLVLVLLDLADLGHRRHLGDADATSLFGDEGSMVVLTHGTRIT